MNHAIRKPVALGLAALTVLGASSAFALSTSNLSQIINPGTLVVDIVDGSYAPVTNPGVAMSTKTFNFACQKDADASTGTFGTSTEQIYVKNPDAADNGWNVSIAAANTNAVWESVKGTYDFNDVAGSGCNDGADSDSVAGKLTVNPSVGTLAVGACLNCTTTDITKGSSASFTEGSVDSITLLAAAGGSDDIGDFRLQGVALSQTIPAEQPAADDYNIDMVLSVTAI
jgi:hypothetical protein